MALTGSYTNDVQYLIEMGENAPLANDPNAADILPTLDSKNRPVTGFGFDPLNGTMNRVNRKCIFVKYVRIQSYLSSYLASLLRAFSAPGSHGSMTPVLVRAINTTVQFSKWTIRPAACFLLTFSTVCAASWVSNPPNRPASGLCPVLLYRLNHTATACIATAIGLYPGFTRPGKTLDANKHLELIAKLLAYNGWADRYFKAPSTNQAGSIQAAKDFVEAGGNLRIWYTRLLTYFGPDLEDPTPPGDQAVAILSRKMWSPNCPAYASMYSGQAFVVLPNLSGPDPRVKQGTAWLLAHTYPVRYKRETLLVMYGFAGNEKGELYDYDRVIIYDTRKVVNGPLCWLEYHGNDRNSEEK